MVSPFKYLKIQLFDNIRPVGHTILTFLSSYVVFAILLTPYPVLWNTLQQSFLMGLNYIILTLCPGSLFQEDYADGTLEWQISQGRSLEKYVLIKIVIHWAGFGFILTMLTGLLSGFNSMIFVSGVGLATLGLTFTGAIASALCINASMNSFILLPLITVPLGIPLMIISMGGMTGSNSFPYTNLALQMGLFFMACGLSLVACPYALRLSLR